MPEPLSNEEREALAAPIKDAFYEARDAGRTMHQAADDAAALILASDWLAARVAATEQRVREEVATWLEGDEARELLARRNLTVASPEGMWAHLTPLERERFENHAQAALDALAEQLRGPR